MRPGMFAYLFIGAVGMLMLAILITIGAMMLILLRWI